MSEIILYLHILSGATAIVSSLSLLIKLLDKLAIFFWPSVSLVSLTGIGLMFTGVSLVRVCASGIILTATLVLIRYFAKNRVVLDRLYSRLTTLLDM